MKSSDSNTAHDRPQSVSLVGGGLVVISYLILIVPFFSDDYRWLGLSSFVFLRNVVIAVFCFSAGIGILRGVNLARVVFWLALILGFIKISIDDNETIVALLVISATITYMLFKENANVFFKNKKVLSSKKTENYKTQFNGGRIVEIDEF